MEKNKNEAITINSLILSFSLMGFIAILFIFIWKRFDTLNFLFELFASGNMLSSLMVGVICGVLLSVFIAIIARVTKTKIPKDENNDLLIELMNKPYGPLLIGILPGIFEELLFRGFLLALFLSFWDPILAILASTALFWLAHVPQYKTNIILNATVILLSIIISILFVQYGTLWAPIVLHSIYNYLVTLFIQKGYIEVY